MIGIRTLLNPVGHRLIGSFLLAWVTLYCNVSYAAVRVAMMSEIILGLAFWALQIVFNAIWTPLFFGLRRIKMGFMY